MDIIKFDEMKKTWHQIAKNHDGNIDTTFELEIHKKLLNIFQAGDYYYYIFNAGTAEMEFISDKILSVLKLDKTEDFSVKYIFENIHPDDQGRFIHYEQKVTEFFNNLPPEKVLKYKVSYDYRLPCNGGYKWILQQVTTIQSDENGSVIRVLGVHTDISHLKTENKGSGLSFLGLEGEPSYYNVPVTEETLMLVSSTDLFSSREKEVLQLVLSGKSTSEIAEILSLSIHTINSHRKHIFSKSGCSSLAELGAKTIKEGWL